MNSTSSAGPRASSPAGVFCKVSSFHLSPRGRRGPTEDVESKTEENKMENEKVKLLNVLRRIARAAGYAAWVKAQPDAASFCATQYNKVLARLTELEPAIGPLFTPISADASPEVTRIAAREVLAYFEADEPEYGWGYGRSFGCRPHRGRIKCETVSC